MKNLIYVGKKLPSPGEWYLTKRDEYGMCFVKAVIQFKDTQYPVYVEAEESTPLAFDGAERISPHRSWDFDPETSLLIEWEELLREDYFKSLWERRRVAKLAPPFDEWNW